MLLLQFLEICIGDFNLWPSYIFDLLFLKAASPRHIGETAAFFYGHKVPLKVACRVYAICNPDRAVHDAVPFFMGAYYAAYYYQCNMQHMARYFHVRRGQLQWINGRNHPQSEPVLPSHGGVPYLDCRPIRRHRMPASTADAVHSHMTTLFSEEAFHIMGP